MRRMDTKQTAPVAATAVTSQSGTTIYPQPFASQVMGRSRRRLGDHFELKNFGVNLTELLPGAVSALVHHHSKQDEFVYILSGNPVLVCDDTEYALRPGDCCGFRAGTNRGHRLANRTQSTVTYIEIGDRIPGDQVFYPNDDLRLTASESGAWIVSHKDGTPY